MSFSDSATSVCELKTLMATFVRERDWSRFHSPKNLSMSLAIEAAELMEHFQWLTIEQSRSIDDDKKSEVADEIADVCCYLLALCNEMQIDLASAVENKMIRNREKYPVETFRGRFGPDDKREVSQPDS